MQFELRKEEKKEKSQNHEGDLYLLYCILHFNILFSILWVAKPLVRAKPLIFSSMHNLD